jgi:hypothetical protein
MFSLSVYREGEGGESRSYPSSGKRDVDTPKELRMT